MRATRRPSDQDVSGIIFPETVHRENNEKLARRGKNLGSSWPGSIWPRGSVQTASRHFEPPRAPQKAPLRYIYEAETMLWSTAVKKGGYKSRVPGRSRSTLCFHGEVAQGGEGEKLVIMLCSR